MTVPIIQRITSVYPFTQVITLEGIEMGLDIYNEYCFFFHIIDQLKKLICEIDGGILGTSRRVHIQEFIYNTLSNLSESRLFFYLEAKHKYIWNFEKHLVLMWKFPFNYPWL